VAVALLEVDDAEPVLEDATVDMVVDAAVIELVMLPLEVGIDPVDVEPVEFDATVALVVIPDTEAAEEEADVVESIANWPE
jgi:hypothetical protein